MQRQRRRFGMTLALGLLCLSTGSVEAREHTPSGSQDAAYANKSVIYRAASSGKASTFIAALYTAQLTDALRSDGPFTIFVPTDDAFAKLPKATLLALLRPDGEQKLAEILKYHVIHGKRLAAELAGESRAETLAGPSLTIAANKKGLAVDGATVVEADLVARNGVIHLIDTVLIPPGKDILGVAEKAGNFQVLLKAIEAAGLTEALQGDGPFTVFAPTDEAFAKLGEGTLNALIKDKQKLADILKYHVVPGKLTARDLVSKKVPKTLLKDEIEPNIKGGRLVVNKSNVLINDIEASNGIIHAIDAVLIPGDH